MAKTKISKSKLMKRIVDRSRPLRASVPYEPQLLEDLKDPTFAAGYLTESIAGLDLDDEDTINLFFSALNDVLKAHGIENVAEKGGIKRDRIYKMLREHKNPTFATIMKVLGAVGMSMSFVPATTALHHTGT